MSTRSVFLTMLILFVSLTLVVATSRAARPEASSDGRTAPSTETEADAGAQAEVDDQGSVQRALRRLVTIPRPLKGAPGRSLTIDGARSDRRSRSARDLDPAPLPSESDRLRSPFSMREPNDKDAGDNRLRTRRVSETDLIVAPGYYRPMRGVPFNERRGINYRYYGGQPSRYGYGYNDAFGDSAAGDVYRFGFNRGYNTSRFYERGLERQERTLAHARSHLDRGLIRFREGRYRDAANAFKLAADTNHGDPASRIYAAHALFATGRYREAVKYLRRAMELQPKIALLGYDIRDDYGEAEEFEEHLVALEEALEAAPANLDRLIVLGYVHYFTGNDLEAYRAFDRARQLSPRDKLVRLMIEHCHPPDVMLDPPATATPSPPERAAPGE